MTPQELFTSPESINWKLLNEQKQTLIEVLNHYVNPLHEDPLTEHDDEMIDGIINLIDAIQDMAVSYYNVPENEVFNLSND